MESRYKAHNERRMHKKLEINKKNKTEPMQNKNSNSLHATQKKETSASENKGLS